ncbi:MAG: helix-turn-helix domain-containing protein [Oscillatoriophycideae cyanobacterium NC_groundwater_1537_Pr4_S-0.65um_50_18]|nr:helix-turn-helix domain-containing protein [Oscillatoriophycideae cyanobacterium NC_groundwater_1537_Pr4_S-0.65um_50_18]
MTRETILTQQEQVHRLMQIGAYLRQVREDHALSLEEVAARTLIQPRLLRAIEAGALHQLPEAVYIQGFIKRYADSLGLDGTDCAEAFPAEKVLRIPQDSWKDSPAAQLRPLHLYVAYVALIMASVSLLSFIVGRSAPGTINLPTSRTGTGQTQIGQAQSGQSGQVQAAQQPASGSPNQATIGLSSLAQTTAARPPATNKPVQVDMKLTAQSWIEVEVDGEVKLAEVLPEGTERTWAANNQLRIRAGNAGGVMVAYNGEQAKPMGQPGAVEEKTFAPGQSAASLPQSGSEIGSESGSESGEPTQQ